MIDIRQSSTYQAILDEGRLEATIEHLRTVILHLGQRRFGAPSEKIYGKIMATYNPERLMRMAKSLLDVKSWQELLETP